MAPARIVRPAHGLYFLVNPPFWPPSVRNGGVVPNRESVYAAQLRMVADDRGYAQGSFALSVFSVRHIIEEARDYPVDDATAVRRDRGDGCVDGGCWAPCRAGGSATRSVLLWKTI